MRKLLLFVVVLTVFYGVSTQAASHVHKKAPEQKTVPQKAVSASPSAPAAEKWDFFQISFWFGFPSATHKVDVSGIKVGAPLSSGKVTVDGIEAALICAMSDDINGIQASCIFNKAKSVDGLQFSIVNWSEEVTGLQLGVFNVATKKSFQIGIINYIKGAAFPWMPIMNFHF